VDRHCGESQFEFAGVGADLQTGEALSWWLHSAPDPLPSIPTDTRGLGYRRAERAPTSPSTPALTADNNNHYDRHDHDDCANDDSLCAHFLVEPNPNFVPHKHKVHCALIGALPQNRSEFGDAAQIVPLR